MIIDQRESSKMEVHLRKICLILKLSRKRSNSTFSRKDSKSQIKEEKGEKETLKEIQIPKTEEKVITTENSKASINYREDSTNFNYDDGTSIASTTFSSKYQNLGADPKERANEMSKSLKNTSKKER